MSFHLAKDLIISFGGDMDSRTLAMHAGDELILIKESVDGYAYYLHVVSGVCEIHLHESEVITK